MLEKEIRHALVEIDKPFNFSSGELNELKNLTDALEPLEVATKALSRKDATLLSAEAIIEFTLETYEKLDSPIASTLKEAFVKRIDERRIPELTFGSSDQLLEQSWICLKGKRYTGTQDCQKQNYTISYKANKASLFY